MAETNWAEFASDAIAFDAGEMSRDEFARRRGIDPETMLPMDLGTPPPPTEAYRRIKAARDLDRLDIAGLREALAEIKYVLLERRPRNGPRPYDFNERAFAWSVADNALKESDALRSVERT